MRVDDLLVVGGHQHRRAELVDVDQQLDDLPAGHRVEVARRLVGDEDRRVVDEGTRDRGALLLAAGELRRQVVRVILRARRGPAAAGRAGARVDRGAPVTSSAKATFSATVFVGSSRKSWKTVPIRRRSARDLRAPHAQQVVARDGHLPVRRNLLADEQPDEGALAGAGRPDEEREVCRAGCRRSPRRARPCRSGTSRRRRPC